MCRITRIYNFQLHFENLLVKYGNELLFNVSEKEKPHLDLLAKKKRLYIEDAGENKSILMV